MKNKVITFLTTVKEDYINFKIIVFLSDYQ